MRLPAKLTLASVMVLPLESGDGGRRGMPRGPQGKGRPAGEAVAVARRGTLRRETVRPAVNDLAAVPLAA